MSERKERQRDVFCGIELEVVAHICDIGAEIGVREHHPLGLASGPGGVDDGGELAGQNLRRAQAIRRDVRRARASNECLVTETLAGNFSVAVGKDDLFQFGKLLANVEQLPQLRRADNEDDLSSAML